MLSVQYDFSPRELDSVHEMGTATQLGLIESGGGRAQGGRGLSTQLNGQQTQDSSPSKHLELGQAPPIFARFATTSPATKPPTLVAIIPRPPKLHPIPTSETPTPTSTPKRRPRRLSLMQRAPSPTIVTTPSPDTGPHAPIEGDQPSDGPLFRALIGSLERRAQSLRASTKTLVKSLEGSLSALQANQSAQASVDDALEGLSIASSGTLKSEVLGGLYAELLGPQRGLATQSRQLEIDHLEELLTRLRNSGERLKLQDQRRKDFESASKRYYDEISKYLSRADVEQSKTASLDSKQATRADEFNAARIDYCGWLEGLVEAEEGAVGSWLRSWAGVPDSIEDVVMSEQIRRSNREHQQRTLTHSLRASIALPQHWTDSSEGHGVDDGDLSDSGVFSDGGVSAYSANSGGGGGGGGGQGAVKSNRRQHRSSIPADFHYREPGTRDKIKNFVRNAQTSIASAMPSAHTTPLSPTYGARSPTLSSGPFSPPPPPPQARTPSPTSLQPPSASASTAKQQLASAQRKKEGFLLAKSKAKGTTEFKTADSGGHWHKYWVVLTDSIAEFSGWKDGLKMRASPISLKAACVKLARGSDRRFVFEVITPTTRRTYQALSESDRDGWVAAINKSIESLLNGTSTVRGFDSSKLTGTSTPYSLQSFGSTASLGMFSSGENLTSPVSSALGSFSNRLPNWMAPPLARRASLGANRRSSKHLSSPPAESTPRLTIGDYGQELSTPAGLGLGLPAARRGHRSTASEGGWRAFSGASAASGVSAASSSSAGGELLRQASGRARSFSSEFGDSEENGVGPSDVESSVGEHGREILEGVNRLVVCPPPEGVAEGKARRARDVVALAEMPGNATCADCGAAEPKWASWSLGVFLCIRCSGVHRSLGTHISKVRSIELDDWNEEQLAGLASVGNVRANAHWLSRQPAIEPTDTDIAEFIKRKYAGEWTAVAVPLASPPSLAAIPESPIATRSYLPVT